MSSFYGNLGIDEQSKSQITTNTTNIGNLSDLTTTAKNNLVAAINEVAQSGGIDPNAVHSTSIQNIVVLTQAQYDALIAKDANTEYNIIGV